MDIDAHYGTAHPKKCSNINLDKKTLAHYPKAFYPKKCYPKKKEAGTFFDNVKNRPKERPKEWPDDAIILDNTPPPSKRKLPLRDYASICSA